MGIIVPTQMNSGSTWRVAALVGMLCVLVVFFCPAMQGPYSVVHGPVTAFQAARAAAGSRMAVVRAALSISLFSVVPWIAKSISVVIHSDGPPDSSTNGFDLILRC